jgi:hypothetical protein
MKKAILILPMPESCSKCGFSGRDGDRCFLIGENIPEDIFGKNKLDTCPLHDLPTKKEVCGLYTPGDVPASYKIGWNACLKEIKNKGDK